MFYLITKTVARDLADNTERVNLLTKVAVSKAELIFHLIRKSLLSFYAIENAIKHDFSWIR